VGGEDRRGLYADICTAISESGTNIKSAELSTKDGAVFGSVLVEVENQTHLNKVIRAIRRLKGVTEVSRRESGPQTQPLVSSLSRDAFRPRCPLPAGGGSAARHRRTGPGPHPGRPLPDAAGRHGLREDVHHGARARELRPPDVGAVTQQDARGTTLRRAEGVLDR